MDKYEFNIKVEQIKKLVNKNDFGTAMKIADGIDWRRVRNTSLLSMVSQVYEKSEEYQEAMDILLLTYERAPVGKRLLYKLAELALKVGNISDAEAYYKEFCDVASDDPGQHLLRYTILKEKEAPIDQLIYTLESYNSMELEEKWLYELAELYQKAGMEQQCVSICDKIMLMFGLGKYVDKAMNLKVQYATLTGYQMDLVENRDKYEARLRAVEQAFSEDGDPVEQFDDSEEAITPSIDEEELEAKMKEDEAEEHLAAELSRIESEIEPRHIEEDNEMAQTRILDNIKDIKMASGASIGEEEMTVEEENSEPELAEALETFVEPDEDLELELDVPGTNHFMIEAQTPEKGLELALDTLRKIHGESKHQVAKISGEKLNKIGLLSSLDKLAGKDLIIEQAGSLSQTVLDELNKMIIQDTSGMNVVLIDSPMRIESLHNQQTSLAERFDCIGTNNFSEFDVDQIGELSSQQVEDQEEAVKESAGERDAKKRRTSSTKRARPVVAAAPTPVKKVQKEDCIADDREMDLDEFAQCACKYAAEIDCNISGKSMLALYERIEIMEEDSIPLTRSNAENLIEEAADRAEKPSLGKMIKGVFSSKYDKDGLLILKEEHFID